MKIDSKFIIGIFEDFVRELNGTIPPEWNPPTFKHFVKPIDSELLDEKYFTEDIRYAPNFQQLFAELNEKLPSLYIFEVVSEHTPIEIKSAFLKFAETKIRKTPAHNKNNKESKVLYVGKVSSGFSWGRIIYHLGIGKDSKVHGLQILHWAKPLRLKLELHIFEFKDEINTHLVSALESEVANRLKPLVGKHQ